jgi:hypothetical protein
MNHVMEVQLGVCPVLILARVTAAPIRMVEA